MDERNKREKPLLKIEDLNVSFHTKHEKIEAVQGVDLDIKSNSIVGLVGETGCGKSVLGRAIMRLLPGNACLEGKIYFKGDDLLKLPEKRIQTLRGKELALIPQNPSKSLNPVLKIKTQVTEALQKYSRSSSRDAEEETLELFNKLNLPAPYYLLNKYPHQLSGGMNQRVLAAIGMAGAPSLLIADEPTKGLDAVVRGQVAGLFKELKELLGSSILLITHDLKLASYLCDEIGVMYEGEIVEFTELEFFHSNPRHPYTKALLGSLPENGLQPIKKVAPENPLTEIQNPKFKGCKFYAYCPKSILECKLYQPPLIKFNGSQVVRCFLFDKSREFEKDFSCFSQII